MDFNTSMGVIGMGLILLAFILVQANKWDDKDLKYDVVNFIGSGLLVYYAYTLNSVPFLILNGVWALVSLKDIFYDIKEK